MYDILNIYHKKIYKTKISNSQWTVFLLLMQMDKNQVLKCNAIAIHNVSGIISEAIYHGNGKQFFNHSQ